MTLIYAVDCDESMAPHISFMRESVIGVTREIQKQAKLRGSKTPISVNCKFFWQSEHPVSVEFENNSIEKIDWFEENVIKFCNTKGKQKSTLKYVMNDIIKDFS